MCGMMGVATISQGHRYTKSEIFDTFPFPPADAPNRVAIEGFGKNLDTHRVTALAETPDLTMTEIYNWREKLRAQADGGAKLSPHDVDRARAARAGIVDRLHQQIDAAVAEAYGWPTDLAPAGIVARLVALNAERAAEEKAGHIRWLRPDYQVPRFGAKKA